MGSCPWRIGEDKVSSWFGGRYMRTALRICIRNCSDCCSWRGGMSYVYCNQFWLGWLLPAVALWIFVMFLAYFRDNNQNIITNTTQQRILRQWNIWTHNTMHDAPPSATTMHRSFPDNDNPQHLNNAKPRLTKAQLVTSWLGQLLWTSRITTQCVSDPNGNSDTWGIQYKTQQPNHSN